MMTLALREGGTFISALRLRTARGLRLKDYKELTGRDFMRDHQRLVQALHENRLVRLRDGYLRLTRSGMLVSNSILRNLFERTGSLLDQLPAEAAAALQQRQARLEAAKNELPDDDEPKPINWQRVDTPE